MGASLAAFIVECIAGVSFGYYVQDKILKLLGINEKKGDYRLSNFQNNTNNLVYPYMYNASWLEVYERLSQNLNASRAGNFSDWLYIPCFGSSRYPSGFLRMLAHSLRIFFQSFLRNFSILLHNSSSMEEMLYVFPQESYTNLSITKFGLIWNYENYNKQYLVRHQGSVYLV